MKPNAPLRRKRRHESTPTFDVTILADMRNAGDIGLRIAQEVRIQAEAGYRTALVHLPSEGIREPFIHPEIDACVREDLATVIHPRGGELCTRLLVLHAPHAILEGTLQYMPRIVSEQTVVVSDNAPGHLDDTDVKSRFFTELFGGAVRWAATNRTAFAAMHGTSLGVSSDPIDWSVAVDTPARRERRPLRRAPVIGRISIDEANQWPATLEELFEIYPDDGGIEVWVLGLPGLNNLPVSPIPDRWESFALGEIAVGRFLGGLDFLVYYPGKDPREIPETAIAMALVREVIVVLPSDLKERIGAGPIYCDLRQAAAFVRRTFARAKIYEALAHQSARAATRRFGARLHRARIAQLLGQPAAKISRPAKRTKDCRVLMLAPNGIGLGHVTRLLAIARRFPKRIEPVFVTMVQSIEIIERFGYPVEYIPHYIYADSDPAVWQGWLAEHLKQIVDFTAARAAVFDGPLAFKGMIEALAPRPNLRLVWIRRGMWRPSPDREHMVRCQRFFDLIVEPGDIAETADAGATVRHRSRALHVDPIRLLDPEELLDRAGAAAELGLDHTQPAVLIQLGAGANRDVIGMTDKIVAICRRFPGLQIVLAEWLMAENRLDLWPGVKRLRGFPISRYYNAFDFSISAAGYNTFNEVISFALPTIFLANSHRQLDDQQSRAAFAERNGAAVCVLDRAVDLLEQAIPVLLESRIQAGIRKACRRLARPNGANVTAKAVSDLVR